MASVKIALDCFVILWLFAYCGNDKDANNDEDEDNNYEKMMMVIDDDEHEVKVDLCHVWQLKWRQVTQATDKQGDINSVVRVAKCHEYDEYIRVKIFAG